MGELARVAARKGALGWRHNVFGLFGGKKKKEEAKSAAAPVSGASANAPSAKAEAPKAEVKAAAPAPVVAHAVRAAPGAEQVKLRLKLAAAKRTGQTAAAYAAAKGLADIQAKAGRRLGARLWTQEADRILERDPEAA
jgi:hypothetical protein